MDYLDPKKQIRHRIILLIGYVFVAVAIVIATFILLYQAYGFGIGDNGKVIQNGLVFFSSKPVSAQVVVNGVNKGQTSNRLLLPAGLYRVNLSQTGYRDWQRDVTVTGASVQHFDYPLLIPIDLKTTTLQSYALAPSVVTQSPDRRWLLIQKPESDLSYDLYDLKNPSQLPTLITVPTTLVTRAVGAITWHAIGWADDDQHLLVRRDFSNKSEYLVIDTRSATASINLNTSLSLGNYKPSFKDGKFDQYYLFDNVTNALATGSISSSVPVVIVEHVLAYSTLGSDVVAYFTDTGTLTGKVQLKIYSSGQSYVVHDFNKSLKYMTDLVTYNGSMYLASSASSENRAFIFKDPLSQLKILPIHAIAPIQVLRVNDPDYLSFSPAYQYLIVEKDAQIAVFDIENRSNFNYKLANLYDAPQSHVTWLDVGHLTYVVSGKSVVLDFDGSNPQPVELVNPSYGSYLAPDFKSIFELVSNAGQPTLFEQTSLLFKP
jgi:hypothetical protein